MDNEVVPQLNKRMQEETFELKPAKYTNAYVKPGESRLGGVMVYGVSLSVDENGVLDLRNATKNSVGGVAPHDGLHVTQHGRLDVYPGKGLHIDWHGKSDKSCGKPVAVNLGPGMKFMDDPDDVSPVDKKQVVVPDLGAGLTIEEYADNSEGMEYAAGRITVDIGNGLTFEEYTDANGDTLKKVVPNLGENLELGADGKINAKGGGTALTPGDGVDIQNDTIRVKVDGSTVKFNDNKELTAAGGVVIDKAVIIKEADAKYILHDFKQVEYLAGNKIGYAGPDNPIIASSHLAYAAGKATPNGKLMPTANGRVNTNSLSDLPNPNGYGTNLALRMYSVGEAKWLTEFKLVPTMAYPDYTTYSPTAVYEDETERKSSNWNNYYGFGICLSLSWSQIYPPGYKSGTVTFEFGCAQICPTITSRGANSGSGDTLKENYLCSSALGYYYWNSGFLVPFASIDEYNAAMLLTYEPLTLTRVEDNPTIV